MFYQIVADMNNNGVHLVHSQDLDGAIAHFRNALTEALAVLRSHSFKNKKLTSDNITIHHSTKENSSLAIGSWSDCLLKKDDDAHCSTPFLHLSPIPFEGRQCTYSDDPLTNTSLMSAIVMCNIGIIYHLKSLRERRIDTITIQLDRARDLYQKSFIILESLIGSHPTGNPTLDLLFMVVVNNLGEVFSDLSFLDESMNYFQVLREFCILIVPALYADFDTAAFVNVEKTKFLLNAVLKSFPRMAAAA